MSVSRSTISVSPNRSFDIPSFVKCTQPGVCIECLFLSFLMRSAKIQVHKIHLGAIVHHGMALKSDRLITL